MIGVLQLVNRVGRDAFNEEDERFVARFVVQLAVAIMNYNTFTRQRIDLAEAQVLFRD